MKPSAESAARFLALRQERQRRRRLAIIRSARRTRPERQPTGARRVSSDSLLAAGDPAALALAERETMEIERVARAAESRAAADRRRPTETRTVGEIFEEIFAPFAKESRR